MHSVPYHLLWPGGNKTALVTEQVAREAQLDIARHILDSDSSIEQVGFIEPATVESAAFHLQMTGGEFCGNAARSAGYLWATQQGITEVRFTVSGFSEIIEYTHRPVPSLRIPGNFLKSITALDDSTPTLVDLCGIRHIIVPGEGVETVAHNLISQYQGDGLATGIMFFKESDNGAILDPYVCVHTSGTYYHETACGSGSIALALYMARQSNISTVRVIQPTGSLFEVRVDNNGETISAICLSGEVSYVEAR